MCQKRSPKDGGAVAINQSKFTSQNSNLQYTLDAQNADDKEKIDRQLFSPPTY